MKQILWEFFLFFLVVVVNSEERNNSANDDVSRIVTEFLSEKADLPIFNEVIEMADQTKQKCPDFKDQLNESMKEVHQCVEKIKIGQSTLCTIAKTNIEICYKPIRDMVSKCLPTESKELPYLLEKIVVAVINEACNSTLEEILELFNPCQFKKSYTEFKSCTEIKDVLESFKNKLPSKTFVCSLLPKVRACSQDVHTASCTNPITRSVYKNFHQAIEDNTKELCNNP